MSQNGEDAVSEGGTTRKQSKQLDKESQNLEKLNNNLNNIEGQSFQGEGNSEQQSEQKKQKRGRPAGSKNKTKQENSKQEEEEQDQDDSSNNRNSQVNAKKIKQEGGKEFNVKKELSRSDWPTDSQLEEQINGLVKEISEKEYQLGIQELERIYQLMDLTSLNSTDNEKNLDLWMKLNLFNNFGFNNNLKPAAICVYPNFSAQVSKELKKLGVKTAVVSTNFPTGQTFLSVKIAETRQAIKEGAEEIDMVVNRGLWLEEKHTECINEVIEIKRACGNVHLKVILENSEIEKLSEIYKLSYLSLCAGGDFIKTSTGKGKYGAKLNQFAVMCLALRDFMKNKQDHLRGIKAAGGIQNAQIAWQFILVAERILQCKINAENFRLGASSLATDIINEIKKIQI